MKNRKRLWLLGILLLGCTAFIWGNSLADGMISGDISGVVVQKLQPFLLRLGLQPYQQSILVRKTAHVLEYALLGAILSGLLKGRKQEKTGKCAISALCLVFLIAAVDEKIQSFVPGRTGKLPDILLDLLGGALGIGLHICFRKRVGHRKKGKSP